MTIDVDQLDRDFKYEVAALPGAQNVTTCYTCGQCTGGCPVSEVDPAFSPRRILRMILWGMREELLASELIWLCSRCYTCYAHCPQDVRFTDIVDALRHLAVREGYADAGRLEEAEELDTLVHHTRVQLVRAAAGSAAGDDPAIAELLRRLRCGPEGESSCSPTP